VNLEWNISEITQLDRRVQAVFFEQIELRYSEVKEEYDDTMLHVNQLMDEMNYLVETMGEIAREL